MLRLEEGNLEPITITNVGGYHVIYLEIVGALSIRV
jgi:hypothetical protein